MSSLGERIRVSREHKHLYQGQLAALIGVKSGGVISNWENDINKPDAEKIVRLCEVLDITLSYLLDYYGRDELSDSEAALLSSFRILDSTDQARIMERIETMLEADKYRDSARPAAGADPSIVPSASGTVLDASDSAGRSGMPAADVSDLDPDAAAQELREHADRKKRLVQEKKA